MAMVDNLDTTSSQPESWFFLKSAMAGSAIGMLRSLAATELNNVRYRMIAPAYYRLRPLTDADLAGSRPIPNPTFTGLAKAWWQQRDGLR